MKTQQSMPAYLAGQAAKGVKNTVQGVGSAVKGALGYATQGVGNAFKYPYGNEGGRRRMSRRAKRKTGRKANRKTGRKAMRRRRSTRRH